MSPSASEGVTPDVREAAESARGWILAVGIFVFRAVEWAVLGPFRVLRTYADLGNRRSEHPGDAGDGPASDGDGSPADDAREDDGTPEAGDDSADDGRPGG